MHISTIVRLDIEVDVAEKEFGKAMVLEAFAAGKPSDPSAGLTLTLERYGVPFKARILGMVAQTDEAEVRD